jgi:hypothetical protein
LSFLPLSSIISKTTVKSNYNPVFWFLNEAGGKPHNARRPGVSGDAAMITQNFVPPQRHNPLLLPDEFSPTKLK